MAKPQHYFFLSFSTYSSAYIWYQEAYGTETNHHDKSKGETAALQHFKHALLCFYFFLLNKNQIHTKAFCFQRENKDTERLFEGLRKIPKQKTTLDHKYLPKQLCSYIKSFSLGFQSTGSPGKHRTSAAFLHAQQHHCLSCPVYTIKYLKFKMPLYLL